MHQALLSLHPFISPEATAVRDHSNVSSSHVLLRFSYQAFPPSSLPESAAARDDVSHVKVQKRANVSCYEQMMY